MDTLLKTFCFVDDICQAYDKNIASSNLFPRKKRGVKPKMSNSEIVCIILHFHQSGYRTFKGFYLKHVRKHLTIEFPKLLSYQRFVARMPDTLMYFWAILSVQQGEQTGIAFVDSTRLEACKIQREKQHKVFKGLARKGKSSMGWFYGFKLHICINDCGEILSFWLTKGNEHDTKCVDRLTQGITGKLFGDKGYISKELTAKLAERNLELITPLRKNMKERLISSYNAALLKKRGLVETVIDQLKNISQIEHSRHRSPANFIINIFAGLAAYCLLPKKPSLNINPNNLQDAIITL